MSQTLCNEVAAENAAVAEKTNVVKVLRMTRNWGDTISGFVYKSITGKSPRTIKMDKQSNCTHYLTVGSVLRMCDNNSIVWGSGFLTYNDGLGILNWGKTNSEVKAVPKSVHAVRGPMTREKLISMGVDCPPVYGDPALLFPRFHQPKVKREFKLGVIPHFMDLENPALDALRNDDRVKIINVVHPRWELLSPTNHKYLRFVDDICRCDHIISSSLHGLIVGDAYGIPSHWMTLSKRATLDGFKYRDYYASIHRPEEDPMEIESGTGFDSVMNRFKSYSTKIDLDSLLESCPFRTN